MELLKCQMYLFLQKHSNIYKKVNLNEKADYIGGFYDPTTKYHFLLVCLSVVLYTKHAHVKTDCMKIHCS